MFGDLIKMGIRTGLVITVTAAILILFNTIQIPAVNFTQLTQPIGVALAYVQHWSPAMSTLITIGIALIGFEVALGLFQLAMIAIRWIFKVNEG